MSTGVRPRGDILATPSPPIPRDDLRLTLFNGFQLRFADRQVPLARSAERLVAFLAIQNRPLHRSRVAGVLWPETTEERAGASLRSTLWRLRRLDVPLVQATTTSVRLRPAVIVDIHEFVSLIQRSHDENAEWRDGDLLVMFLPSELLPGWDEEWIVVERERLRQLRLHALEFLCERLTAATRFGVAVQAGLAAVQDEPLRDSARRVLITAYLAEGNVWEALRQYREYRQLLRAELGLEPSREMQDLVGAFAKGGERVDHR